MGIEYVGRRKKKTRRKSTGYRPRPKKMKKTEAKYPGECSLCKNPVLVGDFVSRWGSHWNHSVCCDKELAQDRSQAQSARSIKSTYRRGKSPSSYG